MYRAEKIPEPFRNKPKKPQPVQPIQPIPIEAKEKSSETAPPVKQRLSPLAVLLLLDLFLKKKGDE